MNLLFTNWFPVRGKTIWLCWWVKSTLSLSTPESTGATFPQGTKLKWVWKCYDSPTKWQIESIKVIFGQSQTREWQEMVQWLFIKSSQNTYCISQQNTLRKNNTGKQIRRQKTQKPNYENSCSWQGTTWMGKQRMTDMIRQFWLTRLRIWIHMISTIHDLYVEQRLTNMTRKHDSANMTNKAVSYPGVH